MSGLSFFAVAVMLLALGGRAGNFDSAIAAFEAHDAVYPPPADPVLFVGSSTIAGWGTLVGDFPGYPVMNRGFGGSQMSDVLYYFDRVVAAYDPALIVVYEGDNDITVQPVDTVFNDFTNFLGRVRSQLPNADVAFISVKPSPSRVSFLEKARELNSRIQGLCDGPRTRYIDVFTAMLDANGQPRPELFASDMLHMNAAGYELWKSIVGPELDQWKAGRLLPTLLTPKVVGDKIQLEWNGSGVLEWAPSPGGPWTQVSPEATSGYVEALIHGESRFYRVKVGL